MATTVLVAYATKYGSTREVAEAIAATLSAYGLQTEMRPAREVRSLDGYSAVVLGAALSRLPVAIFALGPLSTAEKEWQDARAQLDQTLATASWLAPVAVELFGGAINPAKLRFPFNHMPAGDARDWMAIRAWASELGAAFHPRPARNEVGAAE